MRPYEEGMYEGDYVCLDFETTNNLFGNPSYDNRLVCAVWYCSWTDKTYYAESDYRLLQEHLFTAKVLVAHNAKFEIKWLRKLGAFLDGIRVFDPMLAQYTLDGTDRHPVNLGDMCERYGLETKDPIIDGLMKSGVCPSEHPRSMLINRCARDVRTTGFLYHILKEQLEAEELMPMYHTKAEFCKVLSDIELRGMYLDSSRVSAKYAEIVEKYNEVTQELDEFTGGINHNSPKQKAEYLYEVLKFKQLKNSRGRFKTTPSGSPLTDKDTVHLLEATNEKQRTYKELFRKHSLYYAALSKALDKFKECCDNNEIMYADFNQAVTVSHRLSSSGTKYKVQFQNLAREFKPLFTARNEGWLTAEVDGSAIEFRVAGYLGDDKQIKEDIRAGADVHTYTASVINGIPEEEVTKDQRTHAKPNTFAPLYGSTSGTPAEIAYYEAFREKYPDITRVQESWVTEVINKKWFKLPTGLKVIFPHRHVNNKGYLAERNKCLNYPVQYLATGEIIPIAVCYLEYYTKKHNMQSFIVNTVHDSVVVELHPDEVELFKEIAVKAFTEDVYEYLEWNYGIEFDVPLGVGITIGSHWSQGEEEKYDVEPPILWT